MNTTYDFGLRKVKMCYEKAIKPLKVIHFQPEGELKLKTWQKALDIAMYGQNELGIPLMNKRLIKVFERHGIK